MKQGTHPDHHPVVFRDRVAKLRLPHQIDRDQ